MDKMSTYSLRAQYGLSMIEVLVTIVILAIGLLGLAGLQSRLQVSEIESYQRAQALILLEDMAHRISANRNNAASYVTTAASPLGADMTCPTSTATRQDNDFIEWCNALQGAAETSSASSSVGAMVGGRGCVEDIGGGQYMVTVAWQGLTPISAPPASVACGQNLYDSASGNCIDDLCRRVVTTIVRVATLL
jgi:type IV pilus assembly protein PilV